MPVTRADIATIERNVDEQKILAAVPLIWQLAEKPAPVKIQDAEFKVFSQFGEDGIIQYLIRRVGIPRDQQQFVEFGVESYVEANTRFLLMNDNWRGLIMDGSDENIAAVKARDLYWRHDLNAIAAFIDADNINGLIEQGGFSGEIGLLSIDIDGNDYWVWDRISVIDPIIVIVEYNGLFGSERAVTIPYDPNFVRSSAHYSFLYWGCSLKALELIARRKGYSLVGTNRAGNNAFFVKRAHLNGQPELTAAEAFTEPRFRDSRDRMGRLSYLGGRARVDEIAEMPVLDVERNELVRVGDLR